MSSEVPFLSIANNEPLPEGLPPVLLELLREGRTADGWCDHGNRIGSCRECE